MKVLHEFYIPGDLPERQHLRFRHYEHRRRERVNSILAERGRIIQEVIDSTGSEPVKDSNGRSELLESVVSREAKRLEKMVKRQKKIQAYVERERRKRAEKYGTLAAKLKAREARIANSEKLREERAIELQSINLARFQVRDIMLDRAREAFEAHQALMKEKQAADEANLELFMQRKLERENAISEAYAAKQQEVTERQAQYTSELNEKRKLSYSKKEEKAILARQKKQRVMHLQQLKGEEATLRLIDALEKKRELERRDAEKRQQIASLLYNENTRAFAFQYTKEEIINQRKALAAKTLAQTSIEVDHVTPGPAEYYPSYSAMEESPAPKISQVKPKLDFLPGTVDFASMHAKSVPGPGHYDSKTRITYEYSGMWGTSERVNFIDEDQRLRIAVPGPATYDMGEPVAGATPLIKRDLVNASLLDWRETVLAASPGPGSYTVDEFTRTENLKNAVKLAPVIDF